MKSTPLLVDADERDPHLRDKPWLQHRHSLCVGDLVRVDVDPTPTVWAFRHLWIEVTHREGGVYIGRVDCGYLVGLDIEPGDEIRFEPKHVVEIDCFGEFAS